MKSYLTLSNGQEIKSPEFLKQNLKLIQSLNKAFSKKRKCSNNRKRL